MERLLDLYLKTFGCAASSCSRLPLSGSARQYFRICGPKNAVAVIGTNLKENNAFLTIARQMRAKGLNAPEIYSVSGDGMLYLQEDLGDDQLFGIIKPSVDSGNFSDSEIQLLKRTVEALPAVQFKTAEGFDFSVCFPDSAFNARMLLFDLNYFKYDFLKFTGLDFDEIRLQDDFDRLSEDALSYAGDSFMYRDFQARNVMVRDGQPWFIDFQGGRRGPCQYDLASFVWNAGTHFPPSLKETLVRSYIDALGGFVRVDEQRFRECYRTIAIVRILQELGAFGFRGLYERKQVFLDSIPCAQTSLAEFVEEGLPRYPYLEQLFKRLAYDWQPVLK